MVIQMKLLDILVSKTQVDGNSLTIFPAGPGGGAGGG